MQPKRHCLHIPPPHRTHMCKSTTVWSISYKANVPSLLIRARIATAGQNLPLACFKTINPKSLKNNSLLHKNRIDKCLCDYGYRDINTASFY